MDKYDEIDDNWMHDSTKNENRYAELVAHSAFPPWVLFRESWKEDPKLLLPRMIALSMRTAGRIPGALFQRPGAERDDYVYATLRDWGRRMCRLGQVRLETIGEEYLEQGRTYLFAVNHMSPMDIPVIYAALPVQAAFVANGLFRKIPVFSYWMKKSGAVFVANENGETALKAFKDMIQRLKRGRSLILFPEGYIHQGEGMAEFKRGGLHAAVLTNVQIVPLCLYGSQHVMRAGSLHVSPRKRVVVEFGKPIDPALMDRNHRKDIGRIVYDELIAMKKRHASDWHGSRRR
jgi:1-acyl-sn-glycerol-3-phosphate acyltransferase